MQRLKGSMLSLGVIWLVMLIIIPVPTWLLDFMLILDLSLSLTILLISMNIRKTLEFSVLPSLLLITTLFRLSLEISSTRLILNNDGFAGNVIQSFGNFVVSGNVLVGFVIFLIIVVVQFIVITKGAERVAEVAARFTLDAMPGKQMAIDADLNTGIINEAEAKARRVEIQREADFFGAMDGASKFVKGDAIVAIVIMVINIVGGIAVGLIKGGDIQSVINTYTLATVGEGLMSQIPALLISTSTGIVVTRTASEENMSVAVPKQLFSHPKVLITTGFVLFAMMLIPGFPPAVLAVIGGIFLLLGFRARGAKNKSPAPAAAAAKGGQTQQPLSEMDILKDPQNIYKMLEVETIEMEFGYSLIPLVDETQGGTFADKIVLFRRQFAMETGVVIPSVRMRDNIQLGNNEYVIKIRGEEIARGEVLVDRLLVMSQGDGGERIGGIDTTEPAFGLPAKWITKDKREQAELAGCTVVEPASVIMTHLSEVIRRHASELIGRREVNSLLDMVKRSNKSLVEEVVPGKISVGDLQKVLQNLLREDVPIKDMVTILETVSDHAGKIKDCDLLTEYVRQSLKRTITHKFAQKGEIEVLTLDPELEKTISSSVRQTDQGIYLALEPDVASGIVQRLQKELPKLTDKGEPPVVVVSPVVRLYFRRLTEQVLPDLAVLSYNELENSVRVKAVGAVAA